MAHSKERAWTEYLAWTRGSVASEYRLTEEKAWERLQRDLLYLRLRGEDGKGR